MRHQRFQSPATKKSFCQASLPRLVILLICLGLLVIPSMAQTFYGSIVGTVNDNTGSRIPSASVAVLNTGTGERKAAQTDANGNYQFVSLVPGKYKVDVEIAGFKHFTREGIELQVEATVRVDAALEIGDVKETINVTAETPLLQTESATLSQMVEGRTVTEMPLNGRNSMNLVALVPGVVPQGSTSGAAAGNQGAGHTNNAGWNNYQIGGGIAGHSTSYIDGTPIMAVGGNTVTLIISQDALQEFRVATSNVSPEYGRFNGGVVNMMTKSGSNEFHGSLYEYFRNKQLNANTFFGNAGKQPRTPFNQNQYGVRVGGPIRKDKTFFFFNWEQFTTRIGQSFLNFMPTDAQRAGNFAGSAPIYDPMSVGADGKRTPFANNVIPTTRFDYASNVIANKMLYWRSPNTSLPGGNFINSPVAGGSQYQYNGRIDQAISDKQRLFGRVTHWAVDDVSLNNLGNLTGNPPSVVSTQNVVVGDTYSINPTTILDMRASFVRNYYTDDAVSQGLDLSIYGPAWATLNNQVTFRENVTPQVAGVYGFNFMTVTSKHYRNSYVLAGGLTKILGRHTLKFGGEGRMMDYNFGSVNNGSGQFPFTNAFTSADGSAAPTSGNAFASFLLGYAASGTLGTAQRVGMYSWYQGYYIADSFQVGSKLTVSLGLRWELPGAFSERRQLATVLLPSATDPLGTKANLPLKGQLALVNSDLWSSGANQQIEHHLLAPRVGLAYRIGDKMVFRAGYGINYLPFDLVGVNPSASPINQASNSMLASVNNAGLVPLNVLSNPFPAGGVPGTVQQYIIQPPGRSSTFLSTIYGQNVSAPNPYNPYGYGQQWNAALQREFHGGFMIDLGYSGSKGTHLPGGQTQLNQLSSQYYSMGAALTSAVKNPFQGLIPATSALGGATVSQGQLLRPFPQYLNFTDSAARLGSSIYHSAQVKVEKRFGDAGVITANYTLAKNIGNTDTNMGYLEGGSTVGAIQDFNNLGNERSLLSFDVPQRFVVSYVLELPIGKGKRFLNSVNGALNRVVGGWGINGIVTQQSGFPVALSAQPTTLSQSFGAGTPRPNVAAGCSKTISGSAQSRLSQWLNTACFSQPDRFAFGSESRVDSGIRISGINNFDFTITKNTEITERFKLQFRTEFFNLFNRVQFGAPGLKIGQNGFGAISTQANQPRLVQLALRLSF